MTVSSQITRDDYNGNGVTVLFPVTFRFLESSHLRVIRTVVETGVATELVLDSLGPDGFSVTGAGQPSGGQVTVVTAPKGPTPDASLRETLTILREVPVTQETDYLANDPFPAESHERALDKLTMIAQQVNEGLGRAFRLPPQVSGVSTIVPPPDPTKLWAWNITGTSVEYVDALEAVANVVAGGVATTGVVEGQTTIPLPAFATASTISDLYYNGIRQDNNTWSIVGTDIVLSEALPADGTVAMRFVTVYAGLSGDAGQLTYTATGSGAIARSISDKLDDIVSVSDFNSVQEAVARAFAIGAELYWPDGEYVAAGNIPNFHDVRHSGKGYLNRGGTLFYPAPSESNVLNLYVSPSGSDTNDGLTSALPLATIQRAYNIIVSRAPLCGRYVINLAAGTYTENVVASSMTASDFPIDLVGPSVGGHPNVPTAIIAASNTAGIGIRFDEGGWFRVSNVLVTGATTGTAVQLQRSRVDLTNVHVSGCLNGPTVVHGGLLSAFGGIWTGRGAGVAGGNGYRSYYNSTHSIIGTSSADATVIEDFELGMLLSEGCQGHMDFAVVQDCGTGLQITRGAGGNNTKQMTIRRCALGIDARNQWYNNGIVFGVGADANTINVRCSGDSPEFDYRTDDFKSKTKRLQSTAYDITHTGSTSATQVYEWSGIRDWMIGEGGDSVEMLMALSNAATLGTVSIQVFLWDGTTEDFLNGVVLPIGTTNAQVRALMNFSAYNAQRFMIAAIHNAGAVCGTYGTGALDMRNKSGSLRVKVQLSNSADTANIRFIETHTTLGG